MMPQSKTQSYTLSVTPSSSGVTLTLIGGWRINQPYCKGGLAIDFSTMRLFTAGHAQDDPSTIRGYDLPTMSVGTNPNNWTQVSQARNYGSVPTPTGWSVNNGQHYYNVGLMWKDNLLWASGRGFYASGGSYPDTVIRRYSISGANKTLNGTTTLSAKPMQAFGGGFIKGHPTDTLVGNGGYESGQGGRSGPCWCKIDGTIVNEFNNFDEIKSNREKRDNNYSCATDVWFVAPDGTLGYWIAGRIWGGGLYLGGKVCFWVDLGTGALNYTNQTDTFGNTSRSYLYKYGTNHFTESYAYFPTPGDNTVVGCDINPTNDKVYLLVRNAYSPNGFDPAPLLCCYSVT